MNSLLGQQAKSNTYLGLELDHLPNEEQQRAIDAIDGPVLVIAGPGTGKTQLLSLRVVSILTNRDVSPENILCLTFTNAGAEAMSARLAGFIGRSAYEVRVQTFHAFASFLKSRYTEYFDRSPFDSQITDLQSSKKIHELLMGLSITDPLYQKPGMGGRLGSLGDMKQFISKIKKSGLTTDELRSIIQQSIETMDYFKDNSSLIPDMLSSIPTKTADKAHFCDELKIKASLILKSLPHKLTEHKVLIPGSYEPYAEYLARRFDEIEWYEGERNNTSGFQKLRDSFFDRKTMDFLPEERRRFSRMLSALNVFDEYQGYLKTQGFYDFDDMVSDAVKAIETHEELRIKLQNQYHYILIDEFQDTNGSQMRIVELLTQGLDAPNIMAVGDDDQAIMRFQGASVAFLRQFEEIYPNTTRIVLKTNYRSTPSLVGLGQNVVKHIGGRSAASLEEKDLVAHRKEQTSKQFEVKAFKTPDLQYYEIARSIRARIDDGFIRNSKNPGEAIAVIAWERKSLMALIGYLKLFGVDYSYDILQTIGNVESLQGFLAVMHYVAHLAQGASKRADSWLPQVLATPELVVPANEYVRFALKAKKNKGGWTEEFLSCTSPQIKELCEWLSRVCKVATVASAQKTIRMLAKPFTDYYMKRSSADPFTVMEFNFGLSALLKFAKAERAAFQGVEGNDTPLRLGELVTLLDETGKFDVNINIEVPVARPEAVTLKTAHGAKGLEYDLVYLIDADQNTWHSSRRPRGISCPNIYLNESRDDNDMRRLLFVAITRSRHELEMSLGRPGIVGELLGAVKEVPVELSSADVAQLSTIAWQHNYYPDDFDLRALAHVALASRKLSASLLNSFVKFDPDSERDGKAFVIDKVFDFPEEPILAFEFGSLMHRYLELYHTNVVLRKNLTAEELLYGIHEEIDALDFEGAELERLHERLDLIARVFVPKAEEYLNKNALTEQWLSAVIEGVPLIGRSDVLVFDHESKTIRVCDFKTGRPGTLDDAYTRQLVFYKLLIEESGDYPGWTVREGVDVFIEPDPKTSELIAEKITSVPDEDLDHVRKLIKAVYWRIQNADFDTSAFDYPTYLEQGITGQKLQRAYELWLIEDYLTSSHTDQRL